MLIKIQKILSQAHWNFEEQNKDLESSVIIINAITVLYN